MTTHRLHTIVCLECKWMVKCPDSLTQYAWATEHVLLYRHPVTETAAEQENSVFTIRSRPVSPVGEQGVERGEWSNCVGHSV